MKKRKLKKWIVCDCNEDSNEVGVGVGVGVVIQNSKSEVIANLSEKISLLSLVVTLKILTT